MSYEPESTVYCGQCKEAYWLSARWRPVAGPKYEKVFSGNNLLLEPYRRAGCRLYPKVCLRPDPRRGTAPDEMAGPQTSERDC